MLIIDTDAALARALDQPTDPDLLRLLTTRQQELGSIEGTVVFYVVQPGDHLGSIEEGLGFPIATNLVDGRKLGDPDFEPSWEYADRHLGGLVEIVFVLSDDGAAQVVLVPDRDDVDPTLRRLCQLASQAQVEGEGAIAP